MTVTTDKIGNRESLLLETIRVDAIGMESRLVKYGVNRKSWERK